MTHQVISVINERIKAAHPNSPIALFSLQKKNLFDAVYANTVLTQQRIRQRDPFYIGSFYGLFGLEQFKQYRKDVAANPPEKL